MSETPREVFSALLGEWLSSLLSHGMTLQSFRGGPRISEHQLAELRAEYLARFDAAAKAKRAALRQAVYDALMDCRHNAFDPDGEVWDAISGTILTAEDYQNGVPPPLKDATGVKVPAHIIEACAKEYMLRRAEGRLGYDTDDHRQAFIRGYVACAVTFAQGVDGEISAPESSASEAAATHHAYMVDLRLRSTGALAVECPQCGAASQAACDADQWDEFVDVLGSHWARVVEAVRAK